VCGGSDQPPLAGCSGDLDWDGARDFCQAGGARLCSSEELSDMEARSTGCDYDAQLVWSSTPCGALAAPRSFEVVFGDGAAPIAADRCQVATSVTTIKVSERRWQ